jgi:hypothetical protein
MLREYYPAALAAFGADLAGREALAVLTVAPSPDQGRRLSQARLESLLRKARPKSLRRAVMRARRGQYSWAIPWAISSGAHRRSLSPSFFRGVLATMCALSPLCN